MFNVILRLPLDVEAKFRAKLEQIRKLHNREVAEFEKTLAKMTVTQINDARARRDELIERGKRITLHNLLRATVETALPGMDDRAVLDLMAREGLALGRPRLAAQDK